jgi:hypothetical protein
MTSDLTYYRTSDEYQILVEEIAASYIEAAYDEKERLFIFKHQLYETITQHPAYTKHAKGNTNFISNLAHDVQLVLGEKAGKRLSPSTIYDAIQVFEKEPDPEKLMSKLATKYGKGFTWRHALEDIRPNPSFQPLETTKCAHRCAVHK